MKNLAEADKPASSAPYPTPRSPSFLHRYLYGLLLVAKIEHECAKNHIYSQRYTATLILRFADANHKRRKK
jgi:hypothetical protein